MNILNIIWKEFRQNIRDWKANSMMVLFPVVLILILGTAFSRVFDNSVQLNDARVLYTIQAGSGIAGYFEEFLTQGKELGIIFEETQDVDRGIRSVEDVTYSSYILFEGNSNNIRFYKNARYNFEANFIEGYVNAFVQRYNAYAEIARSNPAALDKAMAEAGKEYVRVSSLDTKRQPRSIDYYSITMLTLILMYASLTGMWGIRSEQRMKTGNRILCGPVNKYELMAGNVIGDVSVTIVQAVVVIAVSKYVLAAYWGSNILAVMGLVLSQSVMTISLGVGMAYLIRNEGAASGVLNTVIPIVVLLGGGYTPLENMGGFISKISVISPVKWINDALFRLIYDNDYSLFATAIIINIVVAAVFLTAAALLSRKEAV